MHRACHRAMEGVLVCHVSGPHSLVVLEVEKRMGPASSVVGVGTPTLVNWLGSPLASSSISVLHVCSVCLYIHACY